MILTDRGIWKSFHNKELSVCERNQLLKLTGKQRREAECVQEIFDANQLKMDLRYPIYIEDKKP